MTKVPMYNENNTKNSTEEIDKNKYSYKLRIESDEKIIKINRVKTVEKEGTYKIEGDLTKVETGNVIKIIGESADKKDKKEYVIEVEREKSRNANLKEIKVSEGVISPEFNKEIKEYTLKIGENVERVKIMLRMLGEKDLFKKELMPMKLMLIF